LTKKKKNQWTSVADKEKQEFLGSQEHEFGRALRRSVEPLRDKGREAQGEKRGG